MSPKPSAPCEYVSASIIRRIFNEGKYWERALAGELKTHISRDRCPDPPPAGEPVGTRSQIVYYYDQGEPVAVVHQYLRPDGTLGASGRPDPKHLVVNGRRISVKPHH